MNIETDVSEHAPMQMIELTVVNRPPWYITYEYRGFKITYEKNRNQRIARIDQDGQLRCWASDLQLPCVGSTRAAPRTHKCWS